MASKISNLIPEYPWRRVFTLTSIAALVAVWGRVQLDSVPLPNIPAFKNLKEEQKKKIKNYELFYKLIKDMM